MNTKKTISAKITQSDYERMLKIVESEGYMNSSDFVRQAVKEKMQKATA